MKKIKWPFLFLAFAAALCISLIGVAIGYRSVLGVMASLVGLVIVMGFGFKKKKKMRENGEL